ncbi:MAG TPA: ABC transporter ATP-binding protein, partial [Candidatus Dojkabacteria bacterium]|nr:ABC transporter ATP-binding protein [Candidatus Dojkabacteria bacterium]
IGHDLAKYFGFRVAQFAGLDAKFAALRHMYKLDLNWHEKENSGNKIKRIDNAYKAIKDSIESIYKVIIEATINSLGVCLIFITIDPRISLALAFLIVGYIFLSIKLSKKVSRKFRPISKEEENYEGLSFESINNIRTMKMLLLYGQVSGKIKATLARLKDHITRYILMTRIRNHILDVYTRIFEFGIMIYLIFQITQNIEAVGLLVFFRSIFWRVLEAITELSEVYNDMMVNKVYLARFSDLMQTVPTIEDRQGQQTFPENWQTLKLQNLSFAYVREPVLKNLNLDIKKGEKVGIVGISGAGKTTFVKLILDLYEDYRGEILFDNIPLKDIRREDYIRYTSSVSQDTELFNDTLRENILIGTGDAWSMVNAGEKLKKACDVANLEDVIAKLPKGLDTVIGEKGFKLSGGERQRVGIARAVIRNPQLIVFDEATSHLDSLSEKKIQQALDDLFKNVTAIVIAHRLSTLTKMDRIIVLDNGIVVEQGTMAELVKAGGKFALMWRKQNQTSD